MKDKIWIVAAFVLTFAAGVLVGAIVVRHYGPPPFAMFPPDNPEMRRFPRHEARPPIPSVSMLQKQLGLDETQHEQIAGIVEKYRGQFQEHFRQFHPVMQGLLVKMRGEIESVLRPEQLDKFRRDFPGRERHGIDGPPVPKDSAFQEMPQ